MILIDLPSLVVGKVCKDSVCRLVLEVYPGGASLSCNGILYQ